MKLFFDTFSRRLASVEEGLRGISSEIAKLRLSRDISQISDLVLLDRLQKLEGVLYESLTWIKQIADTKYSRFQPIRQEPEKGGEEPSAVETPLPGPVQKVFSTVAETGSLSSITTPTELQVLSVLADRGPMAAPEIGRAVGRSREHSARLMRKLFDEGYVRRDQTRIPFRYSLVERVRQSFRRDAAQQEGQGTVSVPQN